MNALNCESKRNNHIFQLPTIPMKPLWVFYDLYSLIQSKEKPWKENFVFCCYRAQIMHQLIWKIRYSETGFLLSTSFKIIAKLSTRFPYNPYHVFLLITSWIGELKHNVKPGYQKSSRVSNKVCKKVFYLQQTRQR